MAEQKRGNQPDMAFGLFLIALASIALFEIRDLESGTAAEMSTGYVPRALSLVLLGTGIAYAVRGFLQRVPEAIPPVRWRSFLLVAAAIASFALLLEPVGLFGATLVMTVFASLANDEFRWKEMVPFALILAAVTVVIFIVGLSLPLPIWPAFIG